ncbi:D-glycerate dehydrogenase [Brevibacillus humidisoli]|uniref:2-hydroxyacid dehydrogenase n=1 Tax=Brevibacillus humidisoli TaxID=2895522 RepID=UPI001E3D5C3C|nr:D-glycerate dehydrogenase [Brevibacillus humidisoli]UFJ41413.1 D-glycerate dehydrogenase [Brevibacillus humidisoli]
MSKPKLVVTRELPEEAMHLLKEEADLYVWESESESIPRSVLLQEVQQATGIVTNVADSIDREVLDAAPHLRVVSTMAVGFDNIDVNTATQRGIAIGHTPGILTETTADLTFALLMATARRVVDGDRFVRNGEWKSWGPMLLTGQDIYGATIGIIGMGRIGEAVARRAAGFAMKLLYHNRSRRPEVEQKLGAEYRSLDELLAESDYVVLMAPGSPDTYRMIGAREISLMKRSAVFINTSRGTNVDEQALYQALKEKRIWAAGLDVFEQEPIRTDHPLLSLDNVVVLPHIGSASIATRTRMAVIAAKNALAGIRGERLLHTVNPEVYEA